MPFDISELRSMSLTVIEIHRVATTNRALIVRDRLSINPRKSEIEIALCAFDEDGGATKGANYLCPAGSIKLVCWDILNRSLEEWTDTRGFVTDEGLKASRVEIWQNRSYRKPFFFTIRNGQGKVAENHGVEMGRGEEVVSITLSVPDARILAQTVLDYIRDWEIVNWRRRQEAMAVTIPSEEAL